MIVPVLIGYELRRLVLARSFWYGALVLMLFSLNVLGRLIVDGFHGAPPYSPLGYALFLSIVNPMLLALLLLWWGGAFSERERAARRVILSAPISPAGYHLLRAATLGLGFLLISALIVCASFGFYAWQFGFYSFHQFGSPLLVFWLPSAVLVLGLGSAVGRLHPRLPFFVLPLCLFTGMFNLGLPSWLDLCSNNFLLEYPRMLMRKLGTGEMVYYLPGEFVASRLLFVLLGLALLAWAATRRGE